MAVFEGERRRDLSRGRRESEKYGKRKGKGGEGEGSKQGKPTGSPQCGGVKKGRLRFLVGWTFRPDFGFLWTASKRDPPPIKFASGDYSAPATCPLDVSKGQ